MVVEPTSCDIFTRVYVYVYVYVDVAYKLTQNTILIYIEDLYSWTSQFEGLKRQQMKLTWA